MHNKHFRMLLKQEYVEQVDFLDTSSCTPRSPTANLTTYYIDFSEPTSVGKRTDGQLRHQYAARARVQLYTLLQSIVHPQPRWTETLQQQQLQKRIQDVSAYEMIHPAIDDALKLSTAINNLSGPLQLHLLLQVRPHHNWPEVRQMIDNFFANSYTRLLGQTIGDIDQDINLIKNKKGKGKKGKGKGKKLQRLQEEKTQCDPYSDPEMWPTSLRTLLWTPLLALSVTYSGIDTSIHPPNQVFSFEICMP